MNQAIASCRPGGHVGYVGVAHGVSLDGQQLFFAEVNMLGGPAPVRRFLPDLIDRILKREINPGRVFTNQIDLNAAPYASEEIRLKGNFGEALSFPLELTNVDSVVLKGNPIEIEVMIEIGRASCRERV